jgi:uncharacterized phage protein gp47/JayE
MPENRLPIDYVTKDYDGFLDMMKEMIPTLTPEWTDTSDSDQGMVILQLLAYGLHTLGYYQDKAINENILHIAQTKKAILYLSKFLGYEMRKQTPSITTERFYKDDAHYDKRVVIPKGTQVSTDPQLGQQIIYETDEALVIESGETYGDVTVTQGETVTREFIGLGTGLEGQSFVLEHADVIEEDLQVITEENGRDYYWELVDNFIDSKPNDRHFITDTDEEDRTVVIFGNGIFGMKPLQETNIFSNYRFVGGTIGNVSSGLVNYLVDTIVLGVDSVENIEPATGGQDYEDLEHVRVMAPKVYRTGGKAVTPQDFEDLAENISGVSRALCEETYNMDNDVNLYIATDDYTPATSSLLNKVKEELDKVRVMNANLNVMSCLYNTFNVDVTVYIHDNFVANDVKLEVEDSIREYLESSNFGLGAEIFVSKLVERGFFASGVRNVVINNPTTDIKCDFNEMPKLGSITVNTVGGV